MKKHVLRSLPNRHLGGRMTALPLDAQICKTTTKRVRTYGHTYHPPQVKKCKVKRPAFNLVYCIKAAIQLFCPKISVSAPITSSWIELSLSEMTRSELRTDRDFSIFLCDQLQSLKNFLLTLLMVTKRVSATLCIDINHMCSQLCEQGSLHE